MGAEPLTVQRLLSLDHRALTPLFCTNCKLSQSSVERRWVQTRKGFLQLSLWVGTGGCPGHVPAWAPFLRVLVPRIGCRDSEGTLARDLL